MIVLCAFFACGVARAQGRKPMPVPAIQTIGQGVVSRTSENKDADGSFRPPWKEVRITNIFTFKQRPLVGEKATIVPLVADIPSLDLRIIRAEKKDDACNERLPGWWEVELEPIKLKKFFEVAPSPNRSAEFPFDVAIIYPAVKGARQIKKAQLTRDLIPTGVQIQVIKAAIDLTVDGKPDVVIIDYCCGEPKKPSDQCDYTCGKTFKKIGNGWKLVATSAPC
jgi:hypothetical protein